MSYVRLVTGAVPVELLRSDGHHYNDSLLKTKRELGHAWCECVVPARKLVIRTISGICHLAVWPEDGLNHAENCPFYRAEGSMAGASNYRDGALKEFEDGLFSIRPDLVLSRAKGPRSGAAVGEVDRAKSPGITRQRMSLLAVMHYLWSAADQNRWHRGWSRDYRRLHWELSQVIGNGKMGRHALEDLLYFPPPWTQRDADQIKDRWQAWIERFQPRRNSDTIRTGLVLGEVKEVGPSTYGWALKLKNHRDVFYMSDDMHARFAKRFARVLGAVGRSTDCSLGFGLFAIEITERGYLHIVDGAMMLTTREYVPVDSMLEAKLATALVAANRSFLKPLNHDVHESVWPDFILTDTADPVYLEVFGLNTPQYLVRKQRKIATYKEEGKHLWQWDATKSDRWPPLPPAA